MLTTLTPGPDRCTSYRWASHVSLTAIVTQKRLVTLVPATLLPQNHVWQKRYRHQQRSAPSLAASWLNVVWAHILHDGWMGTRNKDNKMSRIHVGYHHLILQFLRHFFYSGIAGLKEVQIFINWDNLILKIKNTRLERMFEHRGHLCLVFESMRWVVTNRQVILSV